MTKHFIQADDIYKAKRLLLTFCSAQYRHDDEQKTDCTIYTIVIIRPSQNV